ncbi:MAG: leucine-rich repeat domain-containing protein [Treponema sp.]|jgi:hypothetical protein|nr:leucine-rich repeat domain-containing protein [Treponema sp.]
MKKFHALFPIAAACATMAAVITACGNPAMKEVLRPLYEDEEKGGETITYPIGPGVYTVTFSFGTGGGTAPAPRTAAAGAAVTLPGIGGMTGAAPSPVLTGWHDGANFYPPGAAYLVSRPVTLTAQWDSIDNVLDAAIAAAPAGTGDTAANPVPLALALDLGAMPSAAWAALLLEIQAANKFVALDLAACSMTGEFDPGSAHTGEVYISALTLPEAATVIKDGTLSDPTFELFGSLKEVHGANIDTVGEYAYSSINLTTADFPKVTDIGDYAFSCCYFLATVNIPKVETIGERAFENLSSLTSVNLPEAISIGTYAFQFCEYLTTVNLPKVTDISYGAFMSTRLAGPLDLPKVETVGAAAFDGCEYLTTVNLPEATSVGIQAFSACFSLTTVNLPEATDIGDIAFTGCDSLTTLYLPQAASIGDYAFSYTGTGPLTITLGAAPPTLGSNLFQGVTSKTVTVQVPYPQDINADGWIAAGYDATWVTAFTGGNTNITVIFAPSL